MNNGTPNGPFSQTLALLTLVVILFVTLLVGVFAARGAYKLGQAHPNVELYCANDANLPTNVALIGKSDSHEAGRSSGIYYAEHDGVLQILVPICGPDRYADPQRNDDAPEQRSIGPDSKFYRNSPAGSVPSDSPGDNAANGMDDRACRDDPAGGACRRERVAALACSDKSKYYFNLGEADMARGRTAQARSKFEQAIASGRLCGSQYAVLAAKRLAALNLPCEYTADSLARIALDADQNSAGGQVIPLANRKQALKALGYYDGPLDSVYGPNTRAAIQRFERDFGFEETGDLTPLETVYLVCSAAQNANDAQSVNVLGIMYITGLGVVQNTDTGLTWLKKAATRGEPSALLNLALVYGTNIILSSYELCDLPENYEIAASYLHEAAERGQPAAMRYWQILKDPHYHTDQERWDAIRQADLAGKPPNVQKIIQQHVGRGCKVN